MARFGKYYSKLYLKFLLQTLVQLAYPSQQTVIFVFSFKIFLFGFLLFRNFITNYYNLSLLYWVSCEALPLIGMCVLIQRNAFL